MSSTSRRSTRNTTRIDYNLFHSTGERNSHKSSPEESPCKEFSREEPPTSIDYTDLSSTIMPSKSEVEATLLIQEVDDLIDENPISPDTIADVDATVTRLSELRSSLRGHNLLLKAENLNKKLIDQISTTLVNIKDYIKASKNCKTKISIQQAILESLLHECDVYKQKLFAGSKLSINLEKFSGSDSTTDFYTFKDNFNKLHERSTPKYLLPDLWKNNFLKGPALSMVKSLTDIDEIWKQLQFAYGDVKMLLAKKLKHVSTMDSFDGFHRVYNLLDEGRLTRWLRSTADEDLAQKQSWLNFIKFLEKEQKLQQMKLTISQTCLDKPSKPQDGTKDKTNKPNRQGSYRSYPTQVAICYICDSGGGQNNHLVTSGPAGKKIIQYHTCHKFAEMSPANRFAVLKANGFCFQCLFPGAYMSSGKHNEGKCQRDFSCPHPSHQR
eukprot:gene2416-2788_t